MMSPRSIALGLGIHAAVFVAALGPLALFAQMGPGLPFGAWIALFAVAAAAAGIGGEVCRRTGGDVARTVARALWIVSVALVLLIGLVVILDRLLEDPPVWSHILPPALAATVLAFVYLALLPGFGQLMAAGAASLFLVVIAADAAGDGWGFLVGLGLAGALLWGIWSLPRARRTPARDEA